ncbi:SERTA domain-containing protein 2-like isoform X2 [Branchiostoma floridae x Branchiostoma belcheri]
MHGNTYSEELVCMLGGDRRGTKRKLTTMADDPDDLAGHKTLGLPYAAERQSCFRISLVKLQAAQRLIEPSLRRSVLICNTLKHIEDELRAEGNLGLLHSAYAFATGNTPACAPPTPIRQPEPMPLTLNESAAEDIASYIEDLNNDSVQSNKEERRKTTTNKLGFATVNQSTTGSSTETAKDHTPSCMTLTNTQLRIQSTNLSTNTAPQPDSINLDEIFSDLDNSLYDLDFLTPYTANIKLTPLSEDDVSNSFGGGTATFATTHQVTTNQTCRQNEEWNELDHIMEVLVGM